MNNSARQFWIILGILLFLGGIVLVIMMVSVSDRTNRRDVVTGYGDKIALIRLEGVITSSEDIVRQFRKYGEDRSIRAILFRVDSPGGGVVASHEIYDEVRRIREGGKPVVVSMGALAASGGYYVSCGATRIVANPGTLTGSIGVISQFMEFDTLLHKIGVTSNTIKSGKFKDAGNPFRSMSPDDKKYFQDLMDDVHHQFIAIVEKERKIPHDSIIAYADGRVFTGQKALGMKLVDTLGTYEDAVWIAGSLAGIKGRPAIVKEEPEGHGLLDLLLGEGNARSFVGFKEELLHQPILQYKLATGF